MINQHLQAAIAQLQEFIVNCPLFVRGEEGFGSETDIIKAISMRKFKRF